MHPSTLAKRVYIFLFLIIIAFYLFGIGSLPLLGPDEPRYAQVAREMFLRGDPVTPTLGGYTWFEKPALLYWMMAASYKVFGVSEFSARLGPAVCGLLTIGAVWCVGRKIDDGFGFWSLIVAATGLGLIVFSRAASFDVVITMTTTWALACFLMQEFKCSGSGGKPPFLTCSSPPGLGGTRAPGEIHEETSQQGELASQHWGTTGESTSQQGQPTGETTSQHGETPGETTSQQGELTSQQGGRTGELSTSQQGGTTGELTSQQEGRTSQEGWLAPALIGFYAFIGLSLIAKGLVGLVVPFGVVGFYYLLRQRWPKRSVWLSLIWGVPLALAVSALWYGPVIARHGWSFIDEFFLQHHFARYVSNKYHHPQPFYFFPAIILMLALPWTPYLIYALAKARRWTWRGDDNASIARVFAVAWLILPIVFFSFSGSKLPGYVLPALPAAVLLVADVLRQRKPFIPVAIAGATVVLVIVTLIFFAKPIANRESVRGLLLLADRRGYAGAPVLARKSDDRSAQFYAHERVVYGDDEDVLTFDRVSTAAARELGDKIVVLIPVEYVEHFRNNSGIEVIGDNGHTAILGWAP